MCTQFLIQGLEGMSLVKLEALVPIIIFKIVKAIWDNLLYFYYLFIHEVELNSDKL